MLVVGGWRRAGERIVGAGARRHRQEDRPEQQAGQQDVAAEQHHRVAVQQAGVEQERDHQRRAGPPADGDGQRGKHFHREQRRDEPGFAVGRVHGDAPQAVDGQQPVARHHADIGVEGPQVDGAPAQIDEQHAAEQDAEQRQRTQIDAEHHVETRFEPGGNHRKSFKTRAVGETKREPCGSLCSACRQAAQQPADYGFRSPIWPVPPSSQR